MDFDAVVVGAGAVGLAIAAALGRRSKSVLVLEKGDRAGVGISARSSEVIHAGLYYPTGSLRHRLCLEGRPQLYAYLAARSIAHRRCGKLVVASENAEIPRLERLHQQAVANAVDDIELLDARQAKALEPALRVQAALLSGQSGIFDAAAFVLALQAEVEDRGGIVALRTSFEAARRDRAAGFVVATGGAAPAQVHCGALVIAAGLGSSTAAARVEGYPPAQIPRQFLGKGSYFRLRGPAPFARLVYPLPVPGALGVHYSTDVHGQARFGPDLEFVDAEDYHVGPERAAHFVDRIRCYWPAVDASRLAPDHAGIRPKLHGPGAVQSDFRIDGVETHGIGGLVSLFGIESPGLTCALAIGERVAAALGEAG